MIKVTSLLIVNNNTKVVFLCIQAGSGSTPYLCSRCGSKTGTVFYCDFRSPKKGTCAHNRKCGDAGVGACYRLRGAAE